MRLNILLHDYISYLLDVHSVEICHVDEETENSSSDKFVLIW